MKKCRRTFLWPSSLQIIFGSAGQRCQPGRGHSSRCSSGECPVRRIAAERSPIGIRGEDVLRLFAGLRLCGADAGNTERVCPETLCQLQPVIPPVSICREISAAVSFQGRVAATSGSPASSPIRNTSPAPGRRPWTGRSLSPGPGLRDQALAEYRRAKTAGVKQQVILCLLQKLNRK